ncbi:ISNCY family transposase [Acidobacteria bacterium AH-259-O06]|nr:ISNCY family transposase [Acidobacteria bacterium AH-259-O06]
MRKNRENQLPISPLWPDHRLAQELRVISEILDDNASISDLVLHDLCDKVSPQNGARGMTAEQVLRCAIVKQMHQFSYEKLAFHLSDSQSFRTFCRLPYGYTPSKTALQENISKIQDSTWQQINRVLVSWADEKGLEKGRKIRVDATGVESNIRYPLDSQLLHDSIRVVTRLLKRLNQYESISFVDHCRRAKRRCLNIRNSRGEKRKKHYRDLLKIARKTLGYGTRALERAPQWQNPISQVLAEALAHDLDLMGRVIQQTHRRVILGQKVPAQEKIVSIFEEHTDIIEKGARESLFGHKLYLTIGKSSLILDALLVKGNPADSQHVEPLLERQCQLYGRYPRQASFDGGFASPHNLKWAQGKGVQDVAFAKKCGLSIQNMVRSSWVYKQLRRFRAGIEGCISTAKRVFGLTRCLWKGWAHFQRYVHLSVASYNLVVLARLLL